MQARRTRASPVLNLVQRLTIWRGQFETTQQIFALSKRECPMNALHGSDKRSKLPALL
jgi:hypothetical protein